MQGRCGVILGLLAVMGCGAAQAQSIPFDDPMEMQRCIWRCLHEYGPADRPEYNACVLERCDDAPPEQVWSVAPTADGQGWAAGAADLNMGTQLWAICGQNGGPRYLALSGTEGPDAELVLQIDRTARFSLTFREQQGVYYAALPAPYAPLQAMARGAQVQLFNAAGTALFAAALNGASAALARACP